MKLDKEEAMVKLEEDVEIILHRFNMQDSKPVKVPILVGVKLSVK